MLGKCLENVNICKIDEKKVDKLRISVHNERKCVTSLKRSRIIN